MHIVQESQENPEDSQTLYQSNRAANRNLKQLTYLINYLNLIIIIK